MTKEWRAKEERRDATLAAKVSALESIEKKIRSKAQELQKRESKVVQLEEELKHKIYETSRQLAVKEDEIITIKKRFKDEKLNFQNEIKNLKNQVEDSKALLNEVEQRYRDYRKDMEESPLTVLRTEVNKKNIEIAELNTRLQKANEDSAASSVKFKKLRQEYTKLKREAEREKDEVRLKQAEEIERMKIEMRNNTLAEQERQQILMLKEELTSVQTKLLMMQEAEEQKSMYITGMSTDLNNKGTMNSNPFATKNLASQGMKMSYNNANPNKQQKPRSKVEELQQMRQQMLDDGLYNEDDDFIIELDENIRKAQAALSPNRDARKTQQNI